MNEYINKDKISLNQVLKEVYVKKIGRDILPGEMQDYSYKSFVKESTQKLRDICKVLKCDFESFKNDKNRFELPAVVGEIFKVYLSEESGKGSFISKLKGKKFADITFEEKRNFIEKVKVSIEEKYKDDKLKSLIYEEIEDICRNLLGEALYVEKIKGMISNTQFFSDILIEASIVKLSGINELEGFVSTINPKNLDLNESKIEEELKKVRDSKIDISNKLTVEDKIELIEYLEVFLKEKIKDWMEIVNIAGDIREQDVEDYKFERREMLNSKEIVNLAISEYKEKLAEERLPKMNYIHTEEEIKNIIEEIKINRNKM
ncbi:TPA: hypothetical protein I9094_003095 [Clostridium perfringens]|nr:hypothetical protein [Clostridium perfringens]HAT4345360.1 hypothetical protein [Clostridium perfringens]